MGQIGPFMVPRESNDAAGRGAQGQLLSLNSTEDAVSHGKIQPESSLGLLHAKVEQDAALPQVPKMHAGYTFQGEFYEDVFCQFIEALCIYVIRWTTRKDGSGMPKRNLRTSASWKQGQYPNQL
jgi:hypothetical protein